jgi:hypothetical protein
MSGRSACPGCGTILRIRDRTFVGRRVNCPECQAVLKIESVNDDGLFSIRRLTQDELAKAEQERRQKVHRDKIELTAETKGKGLKQLLASPLTAAWLLAIAIMSLVAVVALAPRVRFAAGRPQPATTSSETPTERAQEPEVPAPQSAEPSEPDPVQPAVTEIIEQPISALTPVNLDAPLPWPILANVDPPLPPAPPKVDVARSMEIVKFDSYKQPAIRRRDMIVVLREHLNLPIVYDNDDLGSAELEKTVAFELQETNLEKIIRFVAEDAGWDVIVEEAGIRLVRHQADPTP